MSTSKTSVDQARNAIRAWATGPSDDIAVLEQTWATSGAADPFYPAACDAVFPAFEDLVTYYTKPAHGTEHIHGKVLAGPRVVTPIGTSTNDRTDTVDISVAKNIQILAIDKGHFEGDTGATKIKVGLNDSQTSDASVEHSGEHHSKSDNFCPKQVPVIAPQTGVNTVLDPFVNEGTLSGAKDIHTGCTEASRGPDPDLRVLPVHTPSEPMIHQILAPPSPNADAEFIKTRRAVPVRKVHVVDKSPAVAPAVQSPEKNLVEAKEHSQTTYVVRVARLHALLIAEGVSSSFTRTRCIDSLVCAASLEEVFTVSSPNSLCTLPLIVLSVFHNTTDIEQGLPAVHLAGYAVATLSALSSFIMQLPRPLTKAFCVNPRLRALGFKLNIGPLANRIRSATIKFPEPASYAWAPRIGSMPKEAIYEGFGSDVKGLDGRLKHITQAGYDQVLAMYRLYRGDTGPSVTIDPEKALRTLASLHPSSMDSFSSLFISLLISSCRTQELESVRESPIMDTVASKDGEVVNPMEGATVSQKQGGGSNEATTPPQNSGAKPRRGKRAPIELELPHIPAKVRDVFSTNSSEAFFLDFLVVTANCRLIESLVPRLCLRLSDSMSCAAQARDDAEFTDAVLEARLVAKFISVMLHLSNWSHNNQADGVKKPVYTSKGAGMPVTHPLSEDVLKYRAALSSTQWTAIIDVAKMLRGSREAGSRLAMLASTSVAHVMLTIASVDPVAHRTDWFWDAINVVQEMTRDDDILLAALCEEILEAIGVSLRGSVTLPKSLAALWDAHRVRTSDSIVGDIHFMAECIPSLENLRLALLCDEFPSFTPHIPPVNKFVNRGNTFESGTSGEATEKPSENTQMRLLSMTVNSFSRRIGELVGLAISAHKDDPAKAANAFRTAAQALALDEPDTVVSVAAEWIQMQVKTKIEDVSKLVGSETVRERTSRTAFQNVVKALSGQSDPVDLVGVLEHYGVKVGSAVAPGNDNA